MCSNVGQGIAVAKNVKVTHNQFVEVARPVVDISSGNPNFELLSVLGGAHRIEVNCARGNWSAGNGFAGQGSQSGR